jgi:hypothetical protein
MNLVREIAFDHARLGDLEKQSYVTSFIHGLSRMKVDDDQTWASLASYLSQKLDHFSERDLSTQVYSLANISRLKPIILNFDDLFQKYEIHLIRKFLDGGGMVPGQSISNTVLAYSKT